MYIYNVFFPFNLKINNSVIMEVNVPAPYCNYNDFRMKRKDILIYFFLVNMKMQIIVCLIIFIGFTKKGWALPIHNMMASYPKILNRRKETYSQRR